MSKKCQQHCEVCGTVVELDILNGRVQQCGLADSEEASDELDLGYMNDCPHEQEEHCPEQYEDDFSDERDLPEEE